MRLTLVFALAILAALAHAQDTRPTSAPPDTRPSSGSIFVIGATDAGDRIFRVDDASLQVTGAYSTDGSPSYAILTPDGEALIVTTTRKGTYATRAVTFALSPRSFELNWTQVSDRSLTWKGPIAYPCSADPTIPETVGLFYLDSVPSTESRVSHGLVWSVSLVRREGVITSVPLPEDTTHRALWKKDGRTSIVAVTARNHLWRIDADTGKTEQITKTQLAPSGWLQPAEEGGVFIDGLVLAQAENKAVCFTRGGEIFVVDLHTGEASRRSLGSDVLTGQRIAFVRYSERTKRYLICRQDDYCGGNLMVVLTSDFEEIARIGVKGDPFIDAALSPDGSRVVTLKRDGLLTIRDAATFAEIRQSGEQLPLVGNVNCASIAGWR